MSSHDTGVWVDSNGNSLGVGCDAGAECATCFANVEETAGIAEFVRFEDVQQDAGQDAGQDTGEQADDDEMAMERVR